MQDARYLRSQAELCLQIAHNVSDARVATNLRAASADYFPALPMLKAKQQVLTRNTRKRGFDLLVNGYTPIIARDLTARSRKDRHARKSRCSKWNGLIRAVFRLLTRARVVPTISASVSWLIFGMTALVSLPCQNSPSAASVDVRPQRLRKQRRCRRDRRLRPPRCG